LRAFKAWVQTCAICGKAMDPRERGNYQIIKRATREAKHAHAECVKGDPAKAKVEGFCPRRPLIIHDGGVIQRHDCLLPLVWREAT